MSTLLQKGHCVPIITSSVESGKIYLRISYKGCEIDGVASIPLDASIFMLQSNGKVSNNSDFIFYLQPTSSNGSVEHMLGILNEGVRSEDDDDEIRIRLASIPKNISKLVITVTIWNENAETNFRMMSDFRPYIRLLDQSDDSVIARYDCGESLNDGTALVLCELFRIGEAWLFRALGESCKGGLSAMAKRYGVNS